MGKLGARELNYSSDIDLIVCSIPIRRAGMAGPLHDRRNDVAHDAAARAHHAGADRRRLRLPHGSAAAPRPGLHAAGDRRRGGAVYYEARGQNWERAAMIKAKPVAGDIEAGGRFLYELRPFIWRKHLDYASIADVHSIKRQIHAHKGHGKIASRATM
jgi:glutamate-ammonia-ligase adenylyltransferase